MIGLATRQVVTPSGTEWRIGRRWSPRARPRWRRVDLGEGSERALDVISTVNPLDVGSLEGLEILLIGVVVLVIVIFILIPILLFGLELILIGLLVAAGIAARALLGRPWLVQATPNDDPAGGLAWEVKGWRRSGELIEEIATELAAGHTPAPVRGAASSG